MVSKRAIRTRTADGRRLSNPTIITVCSTAEVCVSVLFPVHLARRTPLPRWSPWDLLTYARFCTLILFERIARTEIREYNGLDVDVSFSTCSGRKGRKRCWYTSSVVFFTGFFTAQSYRAPVVRWWNEKASNDRRKTFHYKIQKWKPEHHFPILHCI